MASRTWAETGTSRILLAVDDQRTWLVQTNGSAFTAIHIFDFCLYIMALGFYDRVACDNDYKARRSQYGSSGPPLTTIFSTVDLWSPLIFF